MTPPHPTDRRTLKRALTLPLVVLYGLGVTIGAGIYVLVGAAAAEAGVYAPVSFLIAAVGVTFTALSYAELATRYPVSAGEAAYVRAGFRSPTLSLVVGLMVATTGVISSAAIAIGAAAYVGHFVDLPPGVAVTLIILLLGVAAAWGIVESIVIAAILTLLEIFGLILVVYQAVTVNPELVASLGDLVPPLEIGAWSGIFAASLLAFFAFIGFEDMVNVAEEVKRPGKTLPRAIILTLVIATALYIAVVSVAVLTIPMDQLATSAAPLSLLFDAASGAERTVFNAIAVVATVNGVLVQMIMGSRVLYGLSAQGSLPAWLSYVSPVTRTPLVTTAIVVAVTLFLALLLPIADLAETASRVVLVVFVIVNVALWRLGPPPEATAEEIFRVPRWVPVAGVATCIVLLVFGLF
jgi:amino acid transporter